tara:strand:- start:15 stop:362 length:348 start_codon:yes stop_codon:yes gene_type:complete
MSNFYYKILSILLFSFYSFDSVSQKIYSSQYEYQADLKVFIVDHEYQSDLKVFKVEKDYQSKGNIGLWFFTDKSYISDKKIYFVDYEYQADLNIFFVKYSYQVGWKNKEKMYLLL